MTVFAGIKRRPKRMACAECGAECIRDYHAEQSGMDNGDTWTLTGGFVNSRHEKGSLSRAIHNDQVPEQMALDKQRGVNLGVEWIPDGRGMARPHFKSKRARDSWDRAHGFVSESHY
jgi:hypothetical protein